MSLSSKLHLLIHTSNAIRFLSHYNIVHMDISLNNLLVYRDYIVKLIDFGDSYHKSVCDKKSNNKFNLDYNPGFTLPFSPP